MPVMGEGGVCHRLGGVALQWSGLPQLSHPHYYRRSRLLLPLQLPTHQCGALRDHGKKHGTGRTLVQQCCVAPVCPRVTEMRSVLSTVSAFTEPSSAQGKRPLCELNQYRT